MGDLGCALRYFRTSGLIYQPRTPTSDKVLNRLSDGDMMDVQIVRLRPARVFLSFALLCVFFLALLFYQVLPILGAGFVAWGLMLSANLFDRGLSIRRLSSATEFTCPSGTHTASDDTIDWIYESSSFVVLRFKTAIKQRFRFGSMTFGRREITIRRAYIRNSSEIWALIREIPGNRRRFLMRELLYLIA